MPLVVCWSCQIPNFIDFPLCPRSASNSAISSPVHAPKVPVRSRSIDRLKVAASSSENISPESAQVSQPSLYYEEGNLLNPEQQTVCAVC